MRHGRLRRPVLVVLRLGRGGLPTPAAMQFKRWDYPTPKNEADLRKIKAQADAAKARYAPKGKGVRRG